MEAHRGLLPGRAAARAGGRDPAAEPVLHVPLPGVAAMTPCEMVRKLSGRSVEEESRDGFCALAGRYCHHAGTYAGWPVTQAAPRCPGQTLLGMLIVAA